MDLSGVQAVLSMLAATAAGVDVGQLLGNPFVQTSFAAAVAWRLLGILHSDLTALREEVAQLRGSLDVVTSVFKIGGNHATAPDPRPTDPGVRPGLARREGAAPVR